MIHRNHLISSIVYFLLTYAGYLGAQPKIFIQKDKEDYSLSRHISILEDKESKLNIYEAASDSLKNKYNFYNKETINFRFITSVMWVRFIVVDTLSFLTTDLTTTQNKETWFVVKNEPVIEFINLYYKDKNTERFIERKAGSAVAVNSKLIKMYDFISSFTVQKNISDTLYLRIKTRAQFIISFNLFSPGEYIIHSSKRNFLHGILFGIFFLLMVYNSVLYSSMKSKIFILYVLYIFSYTIFMFTYEGYYFDIFGRTFQYDYFILPMGTISFGGLFWVLLTREFLSTKIYLPWAYKLLTYISPFAIIIFIYGLVFSSPWTLSVWSVCLLSYYIIGFVIAVITLKKGVYISKYYLIALSGMILGIIFMVSTRNNFFDMPYNFWSHNSLNFGILWEALILAATVGYRFSNLKAEKEIEKALIKSQIAEDLHDEVGSNLSTISLTSRLMMKDQQLTNNSKQHLQEIINIAVLTTETMRDIVWFINPLHDKSEDLYLRMKELASKMLANLNYSFSSKDNDQCIFDLLPDLNMRRHIYLIYKEILNNILKHSDATDVSIFLKSEDNKFFMIVTDNGKGFDESEIKPGEGLKNLRNRAVHTGAKIEIESKSGSGTKIILEVQL